MCFSVSLDIAPNAIFIWLGLIYFDFISYKTKAKVQSNNKNGNIARNYFNLSLSHSMKF